MGGAGHHETEIETANLVFNAKVSPPEVSSKRLAIRTYNMESSDSHPSNNPSQSRAFLSQMQYVPDVRKDFRSQTIHVRLFPPLSNRAKKESSIASRAILGLNIAWGICICMAAWALCTPVAYAWDRSIPGGHCLDREWALISLGIISIIIDVCIFILPIPMVWTLHLPRKSKIALSVIFGVGLM